MRFGWFSRPIILVVCSGVIRRGLGTCSGQAYPTYDEVCSDAVLVVTAVRHTIRMLRSVPIRSWKLRRLCTFDVCSGVVCCGLGVFCGESYSAYAQLWPDAFMVVSASRHTLCMLWCGPMRCWWLLRPGILYVCSCVARRVLGGCGVQAYSTYAQLWSDAIFSA